MMVWVFLLFWTVLCTGQSHTGVIISHGEDYYVKRGGFFVPNRSNLRGRLRVCILVAFAGMPLVFFLAVRRDVGTDYSSYIEIFERLRAGESMPWIEPLYALLNRTVAALGSSGVVVVFALSAALAALPLFYRVYRSSPMPWMGLLILFGFGLPFFLTNVVRAAVAIGIVMLILPAVWRRQFVVWTLGILFAAGFHFTALLVWPLYWILHLAWPRILVLLGLAAAVILSTNRGVAVSFLQWVSVILPSEYAHYPGKVLEYLVTYEYGFGYLIYNSLALLILIVWNRTQSEGRETLVFRNMAILGLGMAIGLYHFWGVNRLAFFFIPALAIFLPWVIMRCVVTRDHIIWTVGLVILFSMMFAQGLLVGAHDAIPYHWIL